MKMHSQPCPWATSEAMLAYHDREWGVPQHDDRVLFEFLTLEGAQAGLSWATILKKRENYRAAFGQWDVAAVAGFGTGDLERLLGDAGIVRHRGKIEATIENARQVLAVQKDLGSLDAYLWQFVGGQPLQPRRKSMAEVPARSEESDAMSKDLRKRGFKFVGTTICYAFMQACGLVNDHLKTCPQYQNLAA